MFESNETLSVHTITYFLKLIRKMMAHTVIGSRHNTTAPIAPAITKISGKEKKTTKLSNFEFNMDLQGDWKVVVMI